MFEIVENSSKATFEIDELLFGQPKRVVGTTAKVTGNITANFADPRSAKISSIQIDARDFKTDSSQRNNAIGRFVLESSKYPTITFDPTAIEALPAKFAVGDNTAFKVTGNLKIRDIAKPVTFDTKLTAKSANELIGTAKVVIKRDDFKLVIPQVPSVANVSEEVTLMLDFTAIKK